MMARLFAALVCVGLLAVPAWAQPDPVFDNPTVPQISSARTDLVGFGPYVAIGEVMDEDAELQISNWSEGVVVCEIRTGRKTEMRQEEWPVAFQALIAPAPEGNVTISAIPDLHQQRVFCRAEVDGFISWSQRRNAFR